MTQQLPDHPMKEDPRIVTGALCTFWGSIDTVKVNADGLPVCPHCGGVLYEYPDEATWFKGVDSYEAGGHPGYRALIEWARGKCFPGMREAIAAYVAQGGTYQDTRLNGK